MAALFFVVDWQGLQQAIVALSVGGLVGVILLYFAAQTSLVWRWRAMLATVNVREPFRSSWDAVFAGLFLNNFLPGTLGSDGLRILLMARACGNTPVAIGAIAYERIVQFAIYAVLAMLASLWPMKWLGPLTHLAIVAGGACGILTLLVLLKWLSGRRITAAPTGVSLWMRGWSLLTAMLAETGRMQMRLRRHHRALLLFAGSSLVNVVLLIGMFVVALHDLGHSIDLPVIVFAVGVASICIGLPISFGGIGVYEAALVLFLGLGGVPSGDALLVALVVRASSILISLLGLPNAQLLWGERRQSR
jgi:uncharacterized membrane protein YbhN (UPF0104 family)